MKFFLIDYLKKMGINIDEGTASAFVTYKNLLVEWNRVMNLTGITEDKEVAVKHFADSLTPLSFVDFKDKAVIDVGTGAGFPGLPLKFAEMSISLTLLDSLQKRLSFLQEVCSKVGVDADFVHGRAEELGQNEDYREKFDIALSRAVAPLNVLAEYDLPFVKIGGAMVALKGPSAYDEIESAENAIKTLGGEIERVAEVALPDTDLKHTLVVIKKIAHTPDKYPRRAKKIERQPL